MQIVEVWLVDWDIVLYIFNRLFFHLLMSQSYELKDILFKKSECNLYPQNSSFTRVEWKLFRTTPISHLFRMCRGLFVLILMSVLGLTESPLQLWEVLQSFQEAAQY